MCVCVCVVVLCVICDNMDFGVCEREREMDDISRRKREIVPLPPPAD